MPASLLSRPALSVVLLALAIAPGKGLAQGCSSGSPDAQPDAVLLQAQIVGCPDSVVRASGRLINAAGSSARRSVPGVLALLKDARPDVRRRAAIALGILSEHVTPSDVPALLPVARDTNASVRMTVIHVLGIIAPADPSVIAALASTSRSDSVADVRFRAIDGLGNSRAAQAIPVLEEVVAGTSLPGFHRMAIHGLVKIGPAAAPALARLLRNEDPAIRAGALRVLRELAPEDREALGPLLELGEIDCAPSAVERSAPSFHNDPDFDGTWAVPTGMRGAGTRVVIDEAHNSVITTANGGACPFVRLLERVGYRVSTNLQRFTPQVLARADILVISSIARPAARLIESGANDQATARVFTPGEIDAVSGWVRGGGSLLLAIGHDPYGEVINPLARALGLAYNNGLVSDSANAYHARWGLDRAAKLTPSQAATFLATRANRLLQSHPVTDGASLGTRVDSVAVFGGGSLIGPEGSTTLVALGPTAYQVFRGGAQGPPLPAGSVHAVAFRLGQGRVIALGDANAYVTATVDRVNGERLGLGRRETGNLRFVLNSLQWLGRMLE